MRTKIMTRSLASLIFALILLGPAGTQSPASAQSAPAYKVIINVKNPNTSLSKDSVGKIFLKKSTSWSGGGKIQPVDQSVSAPVREDFSRAVHGKSARAVKKWWNQQIYSGNGVPPPEVGNDAKVIAYVQANEGAIGYVAADTVVTDVAVVTITQ